MIVALALALALQDPAPPAAAPGPAGAEDEARMSQRLVREYGELGFELDLERIGFARVSVDAARDDLEAQQDALFDDSHFFALHAFCSALGIYAGDSAEDFREATVEGLALALLAYYDFRADRMVFLDNPLAGLSNLEALVAHELAHAWRDQQAFDVRATLERGADTFEGANVAQCLLEGEAELMSIALMLARAGATLEGKQPDDIAGPLDATMRESAGGLRYAVGRAYMLARWQAAGWQAVDASFGTAPASTEALLHPEKLTGDTPTPVALPPLPAGFVVARSSETVVGELGLRMLLGDTSLPKRDAILLAAGWDGDRVQALETEDGRVGLLWRSVWDRDEDAEEARRWLKRRKRTKVRRSGRVLDFVWSEDLALRRALEDALEAHPQERLPDASDAASSAAVAARVLAEQPEGPHVADGRWIHPELGLSLDVPAGFVLTQRGGLPILSSDPDSPQASLVNVGSVTHGDNPPVETEEQRAASAAKAADELLRQMGIEAECGFVRVGERWALDTRYSLDLGPQSIRARSFSFFRGTDTVQQIVVTAVTPLELWDEWDARFEAVLYSIRLD